MRQLQRFAAIAMLFALTGGAFAQPKGAAAVTLQSAIRSGRVSAQISGTGASSGDSIKMKIRKRTGGDLTVTVPPGTMLKNASGGEQNMVVAGVRGVDLGGGLIRPTSSVHLSGTQPTTVVLAAFCAEFEKDNPSRSAEFSVGSRDPRLACILRKSAGLSVSARQAAVWMHTDGLSYSHMSQKFPVTARDWSQASAVVRACGEGAR
jgi:hypothetical protein